MSNLETAPPEVTCASEPGGTRRGQLVEPRDVPLGGPRAMHVRRTLPQRARSLIGAWCFVDHYGPDDVATSGGMRVPGHPHVGLQTVSWLFSGTIEHRDTTGAHAHVRPGELNLMTAGSGIAHSEHSTADTTTLHGTQLWLALPEQHRRTAPGFEHHAPPLLEVDGAQARVFLGSLLGHTSPVATFSPLLGAEIALLPGQRLDLHVDPAFEHGVLVDTGTATTAGVTAAAGDLVHQSAGADVLTLRAGEDGEARVLLLGGEPLDEQIVMWWNFIGRSHDDIAAYREQWQAERAAPNTDGRFGAFPATWDSTLPAPELPTTRLKPRGAAR